MSLIQHAKWVQPFDANFNGTGRVWHKKTTSEYAIGRALQRTIYSVAAAILFAFEMIQNIFKLAANVGVYSINFLHCRFFASKQAPQTVAAVTAPPAPKLAKISVAAQPTTENDPSITLPSPPKTSEKVLQFFKNIFGYANKPTQPVPSNTVIETDPAKIDFPI